MPKAKKKITEAAITAKARTNEKVAKAMTVMAQRAQDRLEKVKTVVTEQHSIARTLTTDVGSAAMAHTADQLLQWGARSLGEWSMRTAGKDGHFAKHVGLYASAPQSAIGLIVYVLELATREPKALKISLGRELASKASNLLTNLGLANSIRALRYYMSKSIDEEQEADAEKTALFNKIAELQKQIDAKGGK